MYKPLSVNNNKTTGRVRIVSLFCFVFLPIWSFRLSVDLTRCFTTDRECVHLFIDRQVCRRLCARRDGRWHERITMSQFESILFIYSKTTNQFGENRTLYLKPSIKLSEKATKEGSLFQDGQTCSRCRGISCLLLGYQPLCLMIKFNIRQ